MGQSKQNTYIIKPVYDWVFFLAPPLAALLLGYFISGTDFADEAFELHDQAFTWSSLAIGTFIHAHLFAVFFRSHGNKDVRRLHPVRFLVVPVLLFAAMLSSPWIIISVSVLATFWDVYHSGMQTFGFARIYDKKAGNDAEVGRRLDQILNQFLYAGPIVAGATMMDHFEDFYEYNEIRVDTFFSKVPVFMEGNQKYFMWAILGAGALFLVFYLYKYIQFARQGHTVSWQKVFLLMSTGACSIYTWGFNSWGEAFFIMNLFHALQYFGLVWASENRNMTKMLRLDKFLGGKFVTLLLFLGITMAYGYWVQIMDASVTHLWALTLVVAIMHFWYDGFIWSVRKKQV